MVLNALCLYAESISLPMKIDATSGYPKVRTIAPQRAMPRDHYWEATDPAPRGRLFGTPDQ